MFTMLSVQLQMNSYGATMVYASQLSLVHSTASSPEMYKRQRWEKEQGVEKRGDEERVRVKRVEISLIIYP